MSNRSDGCSVKPFVLYYTAVNKRINTDFPPSVHLAVPPINTPSPMPTSCYCQWDVLGFSGTLKAQLYFFVRKLFLKTGTLVNHFCQHTFDVKQLYESSLTNNVTLFD